MPQVDELNIKVVASAKDAEAALNSLVTKLEELSSSFKSLKTDGLTDFSNSMTTLSKSLKELNRVKLSKSITSRINELTSIDSAKLQSISKPLGDVGTALGKFNNVSFDTKNISGLINSVKNLSGVNFSGINSDDFTKLGQSINNLSQSLAGASTVSNNTISLVNAISRLGATGGVIGNVSASLPELSTKLKDFIGTMSKVGKINDDVIQFTSALGTLASAGARTATTAKHLDTLGKELTEFFATMARAPAVNQNIIQMTSALAKLASQGSKVGSSSRTLVSGLNGFSKGAGVATKSVKSLAAAFGKFYANWFIVIRAIQGIGKAMDISSSLTEVENVVEATFGEFRNKIEDFSNTSIINFGMSELTAKTVASRFQAMGTAMGITEEKMSDVSVALTALTGDMASFYNTSQEDMGRSLQAIFSGETEPLRKYGLDLTQATLQEYALKNGLDANVSAMTQAEKTMLRYQYVMANTSNITGDFIRTQNSWANQTKILSQQLQQLAGIIGNVFVNALSPAIQALNIMLSKIIQFAKTIENALGKIFGWTKTRTTKGMADDYESAAGYSSDLADNTAQTGQNIKEAAKMLQGFDELNNLNSNTGSSTGGSLGSGLGGAGGGVVEAPAVEWSEEKIPYESIIDSFYKLGQHIRDGLIKAMDSIDWKSIYEKARAFGTGLAEFLNGLFSPDGEGKTLFGQVGVTLASLFNSIVYTALSFAREFDFEQFGKNIADGVNKFFLNFDATSFSNSINEWVQGIWTTFTTIIENIDWGQIWEKIKIFLGNIDLGTVGIAITGLTIKEFGTISFAGGLLKKVGKAVGNKFLSAIDFEGIKKEIDIIIKTISPILKVIQTKLLGIGTVVAGATIAVSNFFDMWNSGFSWLNEALMLLGIAIAGVGAVILGAPALVTAAVAGIVAAVATIAVVVHDNWDEIVGFISGIPTWISDNIITPVVTYFSELGEKISSFFETAWNTIESIWSTVSGWFMDNIITPVVNFFKGFFERVSAIFEGLWIIIKAVWIIVSSWFNEHIITPLKTLFEFLKEKVSAAFSALWDKVKDIWSKVSSWFNEKVIEPVRKKFNDLKEKVTEIFTTLLASIKSKWTTLKEWFSEKVIQPVQKAWETATTKIGEFFTKLWDGIKKGVVGAMNAVIGGVENGINFIVRGINNIIEGFNKVVSWAAKIAEMDWGGVELIPTVSLPRISGYEFGGFPKAASLFWAGENGVPELMGTVGGRTAVAGGAEITGIRDAVYEASRVEVELMRQQNALLQAILEKETGISAGDLFRSVRNSDREFAGRTGHSAFAY